MVIIEKLKQHGPVGFTQKALQKIKTLSARKLHRFRTNSAPEYQSPTAIQLTEIENALKSQGIAIDELNPDKTAFEAFKAKQWFPENYHGGTARGVWDEKLLEHWIAKDRLQLENFSDNDKYIDIAAGNSPWAKILRENLGVAAYALDLSIKESYRSLGFYIEANATQTPFDNNSVKGVSLQCAYEMFMNDDDTELLDEMARILVPGGKLVILPLYTHTHYCAYTTPEYYNKGLSPESAKEYIQRRYWGIPSSRKYDPNILKTRILDRIVDLGMTYQLHVLRNKKELGHNIYCHFILEITKN